LTTKINYVIEYGMKKQYVRKPLLQKLQSRLFGNINLIQAVVGPRQVGKTTLAVQVYDAWKGAKIFESADVPVIPTAQWIIEIWEKARELKRIKGNDTLLILDEIQKIQRWSEVVKRMFDEDRRQGNRIRVIILGSSSLLMQKGLTESLAGRFEIHRHKHWSFKECNEYFKLKLNEYIYYGGYPLAVMMRKDNLRWSEYIRDSLIESVISKDVILMNPISKPALLRQAFGLCLNHPAEILSYEKMIGQLQDAGNTTTIAQYLKLLSNAFFLILLERYSGSKIRQRGSSPKILVLDNSLITANSNKTFKETIEDKNYWGRLVENAVGAKLYWLAQESGGELLYWRDRNEEVDYILKISDKIIAVEVKSGASQHNINSLAAFKRRYKKAKIVLITPGAVNNQDDKGDIKNIKLTEFFLNPGLLLS
jgi:uncharacterized protein